MHKIEFGLGEQVVMMICDVLKGYPEANEVLLYGSRAKGI